MEFKNLDEKQLSAVQAVDGAVRVIAGAGSGKTRALTYRYANIIDKRLAGVKDILCVTFTNKAAKEMRERVDKILGMRIGFDGYITTFHSLCARILRESGSNIGIHSKFIIYDSDDRKSVLRRIIKEYDTDISVNDAIAYISNLKASEYGVNISGMLCANNEYRVEGMKMLDEYAKRADWEFSIIEVVTAYFERQYRERALDFDDLLNCTVYLFEKSEKARRNWSNQFKYIMVDEFQDVSDREYKLVNILAEVYKNIFVVGDPDQTIYTWRGADVKYMYKIVDDYKDCKTIILDYNYRSDAFIVNRSNRLIRNNYNRVEKELKPKKPLGCDIMHKSFDNAYEQAEDICSTIKDLLESGYNEGDIAILYRQHSVSREIEERLMSSGIKYTVYKGLAFYSRKEIKDALAYLRLLYTGTDTDFYRIVNEPRRGFGPKKVEALRRISESTGKSAMSIILSGGFNESPKVTQVMQMIASQRQFIGQIKISKLLEKVLEVSGYWKAIEDSGDEERMHNLYSLKESIERYEAENPEHECDLAKYLENIALVSDTDTRDNGKSVKLMTMHSSKGMEFKVVILASMCDGISPNKRALLEGSLEEERRLAYVGMTRAQELLYMYSFYGMYGPMGDFVRPSRFIKEIMGK